MSQNASLAEVVSADNHGTTWHAEEEVSGTEREAEQEKFPTGQRTVSLHLSEPHVPPANYSCLLHAGNNTHDNLPIVCSGKYHLAQSKQLNGVSFSCTFLPKNPLSWSFWTASLWLWLDQMASWDFWFSTKPFWFYCLWSPVTACFVCARKPHLEGKLFKENKLFPGTNLYSA